MKYSIIAFSILALAQLFVPAQMIFQQQKVVNQGVVYKFKCAPRDPAHPLKGRYVRLRFDENRFVKDTSYQAKTIYASLKTDVEGFAKITDVTDYIPQNSDYIEVPNRNRFRNNKFNNGNQGDSIIYTINYPFNQFFMEEYKAPIAEQVYRDALRDTSAQTYAVVRILDGEAVLEDVQIDGISLTDLSQENQ